MNANTYSLLGHHFTELGAVLQTVDRKQVGAAIEALRSVRATNNTVWIAGNGGSAATASHFANDLLKMAGVRAVNLTALIPTVTAYGNDNGWDRMFADAAQALITPGDLLVAISCSGNSINVVKTAAEFDYVIVLTGNDLDCELSKCDPISIITVDSDDITIQEDAHVAICHAVAKALK